MDEKELERRVAQMTDEEQTHFKECIMRLAMCYGEDALKGVLIVSGHLLEGMSEVIQFNSNDMDTYDILRSASNYFDFLNTKDAPPKERMN